MNDFDFIKDKVDHSGVKPPEKMDEQYVLERLSAVCPTDQPALTVLEPNTKADRPKRRYSRLTAIAAVFVAVAVLGTALTLHIKSQPTDPAVSAVTGLTQFSSYDQVRDALKDISERNRSRALEYTLTVSKNGLAEYQGVDDAEPVQEAANAASSGAYGGTRTDGTDDASHSDTYTQVKGVDEADIIKTDGRYLYTLEFTVFFDDDGNYHDTSCVAIFSLTPGSSDPILKIFPGQQSALSGEPNDATPDEATPDESDSADADAPDDGDENVYTYDLFLNDGRLVLICGGFTPSEDGYGYRYYGGGDFTRVYVYDIADMHSVRLLDTFTQSGNYISSRMIGDTLYLITNEYTVEEIPFCGRGSTPDEIPADCIYSIEKPDESTFLIVSAYDTVDYTASSDSKAILGVGDEVYCSTDNLYISATEWSYTYRYGWDYEVFGVFEAEEEEDGFVAPKTKIFKVSLTDGISFTAYGEIEGYIDDQYSMDEYNGYLRVAATSMDRNYTEFNNLYVLDGSLEQVGAVTGFAETESIKAVRYMGDVAYVITYEQTDPLFVIDLSSPTSPAILGEVKISGFSTMLVPIDENTVLGLGVNTGEADYTDLEVQNGFKLALFDVSDKTNPKVLDSRSYVNFSSPVMYNPKALVYNPDRGDFVIPMNYYYYEDNYDDFFEYYNEDVWKNWYRSHVEEYGAVLNFTVRDGRIVETDLHATGHARIDRCVYAGDTVYMTYNDSDGSVHLDSVSYR